MRKMSDKVIKTMSILLIVFSMLLFFVFNFSGTTERGSNLYLNNISFVFSISCLVPLEEQTAKKELTQEEQIDMYVEEICEDYNVDPYLVKSIIWYESRYNPNVSNGNCVGLMQVSTYWHARRASELGVTDFYDPYSNILVGVDFLSDMLKKNGDPALVLMLYNMDHNTAYSWYEQGKISDYARSVLNRAEALKRGEL